MNELVGQLKQRGLKFNPVPSSSGMYLFPLELENPKYIASCIEYDPTHGVSSWGGVEVVKMHSREVAREAGGAKGERACSWGRFVFYGDKKMIAEIKKTLGAKS